MVIHALLLIVAGRRTGETPDEHVSWRARGKGKVAAGDEARIAPVQPEGQ